MKTNLTQCYPTLTKYVEILQILRAGKFGKRIIANSKDFAVFFLPEITCQMKACEPSGVSLQCRSGKVITFEFWILLHDVYDFHTAAERMTGDGNKVIIAK